MATLAFPASDTATALVALIPSLRRAARRLTASPADAEDLVQDALLQIWARQRDGADIAALPAYARATLRNRARRGQRRPAMGPLDEELLAAPNGDAGLRRIAVSEVLNAIDALPAPQREVLTRVVLKGHTPEQVARDLGLARGTVLSRLARARQKLRMTCGLSHGFDASSLLVAQDAPA